MFRFRGFTPRANDAVNLALSQACLLGHTYIGSEHLLLGLLLEGSTGSCAALHQRGVHAEAVLEQLIKTVGRGIQSRLSPADMTPRCRRILPDSAFFYNISTIFLLANVEKERNVSSTL